MITNENGAKIIQFQVFKGQYNPTIYALDCDGQLWEGIWSHSGGREWRRLDGPFDTKKEPLR